MSRLREDADLTTGRRRFVADLPYDGLHAVFVRSQVAHGRLRSIDAAEARAAPGVVAVHTADTLGLAPFHHFAGLDPRQSRVPLARGKVRHVGEAVAVVVAETEAQAIDAAELVLVDVDPLEPVLEPGVETPLLYEESGTNTTHRIEGDADTDPVSGADVIVEVEIANHKVASVPIETDGILVVPGHGGSLDIWCTSQGVHEFRDTIADAMGLERHQVRLRSPAVGGAFGGRASPPVEFVVIAAASARLGRPVRWLQTRTENLTGMPQGRGVRSACRLGLARDGRIVGLDVAVTADAGATAHMAGLLMVSIQRQATGLYRVPRMRWRGTAALTTTTPVGAYRGAGQPEANHARERLLDVAAQRLGLDPIELRRRNLLDARDFPRAQPGGVTYDRADPRAALELAVATADLAAWRNRQARRRAERSPVEIGIGVACYAQTSGRGVPTDTAVVRIGVDGRIQLGCGSASHGQSHAATWRALVSARLGVAEDHVDVVDADTAAVADGLTTGGSRASQVLGPVIAGACDDLVDAARDLAAERLEVAAHDLVVAPAGYELGAGLAVAGVPTRRLTWAEVAAAAPNRCLEAARSGHAGGEAHPYGTHVSVVEVDTETGAVRLLHHVAVDDCGVVLEPRFVEGQQHGGSAAGIGQALFECVSHDADGNPEAATFMTYLLPSAADLCAIDARTMSTPTERNALGTRGIGENGANAATGAAHNAVMDALAPRGVEHIDLPLTPEKIWAAVTGARGRETPR